MTHQDLENSLQVQLEETRQTYESLQLLLKEDPDSEELKQVRDELQSSVQELQTSLTLLQEEQSDSETDTESDSDEDSDADSEVVNQREEYLESALDEMHNNIKEAVKNGQQKETAHFADWEAYGRGVASKLMAKMGYIHGKGLGRDKQGMTEAIVSNAKKGPNKKSGLGTEKDTEMKRKKKTKRGGRVKTAKKRRRLAKEALDMEKSRKQLETDSQGVFAVINRVIGDHSEAAKERQSKKEKTESRGRTESEKREMLVSQMGKIGDCKKKVAQLESSLKRNLSNKAMADGIRSKLKTAQSELSNTERLYSKLTQELERNL